jgi:hypothetical protein
VRQPARAFCVFLFVAAGVAIVLSGAVASAAKTSQAVRPARMVSLSPSTCQGGAETDPNSNPSDPDDRLGLKECVANLVRFLLHPLSGDPLAGAHSRSLLAQGMSVTLTPTKHCKKGYVLKKGRCVKKKKPGTKPAPVGPPLTRVSQYAIFGPNGFRQGPCTVADNIATCVLDPPLQKSELFVVGFGPKPPSGTTIYVEITSNGVKTLLKVNAP